MEINDLGEKFKELADKMEERFKTPEEKKKYREALNSPEIQNKVNRAMDAINKIIDND